MEPLEKGPGSGVAVNQQVKWIRVQISITNDIVLQIPAYSPRAWEAEMGSWEQAGLVVIDRFN